MNFQSVFQLILCHESDTQFPGPLPKFTPTSSPELDTLLATFRSNVFMPSHLITLQQDLLYKKKNHYLLTSDEPATVRLGDEVLQLHPLDHKKDEPPTRSSVAKVVNLMAETKDWRNLPGFLEGLKTARRRVPGYQIEKMVRKANEDGRQGVIHDCLRRVESTGFALCHIEVGREVMRGAVYKAIQNGWSEEGVEKAVKYAQNIWELMFDPRHTEDQTAESDPKRRSDVIGVLVQLHAAKAFMFGDRKDQENLVEKYATMMLTWWDNAELEVKQEDRFDASKKLLMWAPVWHGMKMACQVLEAGSPQLAAKLSANLTKDLEPLIQKTQAILSAHPPQTGSRRGLKMYEDLPQVSS